MACDTGVLDLHDDLTCVTSAAGPESGDGIAVDATCRTEETGGTSGPRHLEVNSHTGFTTEDLPTGQEAVAVATLINEISIPEAPASGGSDVLPVQIATEVNWSGVLLAAGVNSTFAQVVATLQARDMETNEVVASNTFLFERVDADLTLNVIDALEGMDLTNSSGADITALMKRGRTYRIEVEAKCHVSVPLMGAALCTFIDSPVGLPGADDLLGGDGFDVKSITVTVAGDPVETLLGN